MYAFVKYVYVCIYEFKFDDAAFRIHIHTHTRLSTEFYSTIKNDFFVFFFISNKNLLDFYFFTRFFSNISQNTNRFRIYFNNNKCTRLFDLWLFINYKSTIVDEIDEENVIEHRNVSTWYKLGEHRQITNNIWIRNGSWGASKMNEHTTARTQQLLCSAT